MTRLLLALFAAFLMVGCAGVGATSSGQTTAPAVNLPSETAATPGTAATGERERAVVGRTDYGSGGFSDELSAAVGIGYIKPLPSPPSPRDHYPGPGPRPDPPCRECSR